MQEQEVQAYFQAESSYWRDIYSKSGVYAQIHRDRYQVVLGWIDELSLPPGSRVLEVGCGAGFLAIALAQRGCKVVAMDSAANMIELARRHAEESKVSDSVSFVVADIYALRFNDADFDLVTAIGVLPWLEQPELAIQQLARVTKEGGHVIVTADNKGRLNNLLDPWLNPALAPLKRGVKQLLDRVGLRPLSLRDVGANSHSRRFIDAALAQAQLEKVRSVTLGFGPFSLMRGAIIPQALGTSLHRHLQRLADRGLPVFRATGAHYIVEAKKA